MIDHVGFVLGHMRVHADLKLVHVWHRKAEDEGWDGVLCMFRWGPPPGTGPSMTGGMLDPL